MSTAMRSAYLIYVKRRFIRYLGNAALDLYERRSKSRDGLRVSKRVMHSVDLPP